DLRARRTAAHRWRLQDRRGGAGRPVPAHAACRTGGAVCALDGLTVGSIEIRSVETAKRERDWRDIGWKFTAVPLFCIEPQFCGGNLETRFCMTSGSWIRRLGAPFVALILTVGPLLAPIRATEDARKVGVVSFGLFGDQGVFRSEATGA